MIPITLTPRLGPARPMPRFVQIEPVGQCNLKCRMCPVTYRSDGRPGRPAFIAPDVFRRLIDEFGAIDELQLQGLGEPMLHPQFFDMVSYAARRGIRVSTNTNLTLVTAQRARLCIASGLHALHASIDGASAATYEFIRRGAKFVRTLRNLDRIVAERRKTGSATPHLRIVTVAMRRNLHELPGIVELAAHHGVDLMFVQHLCHDFGESTLPEAYRSMRDFVAAQSLLGEDQALVAQRFDEARTTARRCGVDLRLPPLATSAPPRPRSCDWPDRGAYLSFRGEAMPCCMVSTPDRINLGNMAVQGIEAVWNGPAYRRFRGALASDEPPEICRGCAIYNGTF